MLTTDTLDYGFLPSWTFFVQNWTFTVGQAIMRQPTESAVNALLSLDAANGNVGQWEAWLDVQRETARRESVIRAAQEQRERITVSEALASQHSADCKADRKAVKRLDDAIPEPQLIPHTDKRGRLKTGYPNLKAKGASVVCPRDMKIEDDKGILVVTTVRKLVRVFMGGSKARSSFFHFLDQSGSRAVNLERADGNVQEPPDDYKVFHAEDDGQSRPANAQERKAGHWPQTIWYAVDMTPEALAFLSMPSTRWILAMADDCPVNPPTIGTGQTAK